MLILFKFELACTHGFPWFIPSQGWWLNGRAFDSRTRLALSKGCEFKSRPPHFWLAHKILLPKKHNCVRGHQIGISKQYITGCNLQRMFSSVSSMLTLNMHVCQSLTQAWQTCVHRVFDVEVTPLPNPQAESSRCITRLLAALQPCIEYACDKGYVDLHDS